MASPIESLPQIIRRYAVDGWYILKHRGAKALFGAALQEAAGFIDKPIGPFLPLRELRGEGRAFLRQHGLRGTLGGILRASGAQFMPPFDPSKNPVNNPVLVEGLRHLHTYDLTKPDGVVPSRRPVNEMDYALEVPFANPGAPATQSIAVIIHCFYPEVLPELLEKLENIPQTADLFLSCDSEEKKREIEGFVRAWAKGHTEVRILPNRGRDIGAKFVGFRDVYARYELFLHLHTKKSPHGGVALGHWRDHLIDNLLGSAEIVRSILSLFEDEKLGIVFPQHLYQIRGILNWGYNFDHARELMQRIGVRISKDMPLEFPSGSMFWGRSAAIRPLLDAGLSYDDFPPEGGHVDGTLAHAIERCILIAAEAHGFEWLKVVCRPFYPLPDTVLRVNTNEDLPLHRLKVFRPCLGFVDSTLPPFSAPVRETAPVRTYPSRSRRGRLNLIINTLNPQQSFGGVATALKCFRDWAQALGEDFDQRILVTDAEVLPEAYAAFPDFVAQPFLPSLDEAPRVIVDAYMRHGGAIDLRENDLFIATAWWTAPIATSFDDTRHRLFGKRLPFVYLIQDDERYFQGWGSRFALAEATYRHKAPMIAVLNAEELYQSMVGTYGFSPAFVLPYALNAKIDRLLAPHPRERKLLVYGRPSVARNAFELICAGLMAWQQADPIRASRWQLCFLGEDFDPALLHPLQNASIEGKLSLEAYADHLNRASVGISMMLSPHPSYPPLEMAAAGLRVITNRFGQKDLSQRFANIRSLDMLSVEALAGAIEDAVVQAETNVGMLVPRVDGIQPALPGPLAEPATIAALIRAQISTPA